MAEETRLAVIEAASRLFAEHGFAGTGMRDIAQECGVSVETVYGTAGSKSQLLMRAIDVGVVGDDAPVPLAERPEFAQLGSGDRPARLAQAARMVSAQYSRVARLHTALEGGAMADPELARKLEEMRARQRSTFGEGVALVLGRSLEPDEVDGLQAIGSPEVYLLLVESAGWSEEKYQEWLAVTLGRLLEHLPEETT
jgi:AcrR family transcriptional regulator